MLPRFTLLAAVICFTGSLRTVVVRGALDDPPPCMTDVAAECSQNAIQSVRPSACNWNLIMPRLSECVTDAVSGCTTKQILEWLRRLTEFNATLNSASCAPSCPDPQGSISRMNQCYNIVDDVTGNRYTTLEAVVAAIHNSPSKTNAACQLLSTAVNCLTTATAGCTALMDLTDERLNAMNASSASEACDVKNFVGPTTNAPVDIIKSVTSTASTTTTVVKGAVVIGEGSNNTLTTTWIVLMVLASLLLLFVVIIIIVLIRRTVAFRKQSRLPDSRQSRQGLLDAEQSETVTRPKFRLISTKHVDQTDWPPGNYRPFGARDLFHRAY